MFKSPVYLVPYDFTTVSESALRIGLELATTNNGFLYLLHIVKKDADKKEAKRKFSELLKHLSSSDSERVLTKVISGNLYEIVGNAGDILNASLTIMGTHGAKGIQKIVGSNALKMVSKSPTPFLVTTGEKHLDKIETIVMPFSFVKESIQIIKYVGSLAKEFEAVIHLVGYHDDDEWLKGKSHVNQQIVGKALSDLGVHYEIVNLPKQKSYEEELSDYLLSVNADLIAATYFRSGILPPPNTFIQVMLENDLEIPILTINADELGISSSLSFMSV